ncbi:unnamed protein product, partial [Penicillium egyptiacum]
QPIPLADPGALASARDVCLDRLTYPFDTALQHTRLCADSDGQPVLTP